VLHPSTKVMLVIVLGIAVQALQTRALIFLGLMLMLLMIQFRAVVFWRMLRRTRWLLLTLLLVFALTTPGEYLPNWPYEIGPTYEGLYSGAIQAGRLTAMIAGLSLLLATTDREHLIAGLLTLLHPLNYLKLPFERFAARLWLTLHYVEQPSSIKPGQRLTDRLAAFSTIEDESTQSAPETIVVPLPLFTWRDGLVVLGMIILGLMMTGFWLI
jgi:energy-coupling factor transporter transmembrane protein EcfT